MQFDVWSWLCFSSTSKFYRRESS